VGEQGRRTRKLATRDTPASAFGVKNRPAGVSVLRAAWRNEPERTNRSRGPDGEVFVYEVAGERSGLVYAAATHGARAGGLGARRLRSNRMVRRSLNRNTPNCGTTSVHRSYNSRAHAQNQDPARNSVLGSLPVHAEDARDGSSAGRPSRLVLFSGRSRLDPPIWRKRAR
jgi:hypothetical protein